MRGTNEEQGFIFTYLSPEQRVPQGHPLRTIKANVDAVLKGMSPTFEGMYSNTGRPSIPPERLLKSQLLIALYSVRGDRMFCESLDYNILYRWFLDMNLEEASFDHSTFSKNRDRLMEHEVAREYFSAVVEHARSENRMSDEHFTVDGTLIEACASMKSFVAKGGKAATGRSVQSFRGFPRREAEKRHPRQHYRSGRTAYPQGQGEGGQAFLLLQRADGEPERIMR